MATLYAPPHPLAGTPSLNIPAIPAVDMITLRTLGQFVVHRTQQLTSLDRSGVVLLCRNHLLDMWRLSVATLEAGHPSQQHLRNMHDAGEIPIRAKQLRTAWLAKMAFFNRIQSVRSEANGGRITFEGNEIDGGVDGTIIYRWGDASGHAPCPSLDNGPPTGHVGNAIHPRARHSDANGSGPVNGLDQHDHYAMEEKSNYEKQGHEQACSYPITGNRLYPENYARFMLIINKVTDENGTAHPLRNEQQHCLFIPFSAVANANCASRVLGHVCTCCGAVNPGHACNYIGSGNVLPARSDIKRAHADPLLPASLAYDAAVGFAFAPALIPYNATIVAPTQFLSSRWAMGFYIKLNDTGTPLSAADQDRIVAAMTLGKYL